MNESGQKFNSSYSNNSFYCSTNNIINNNTLGILRISYIFANKVILIDNCNKHRLYRYRDKTNKDELKKSQYNYINNRKNNTANCFTKDPSLFNQQQMLTEEQITLYRTIIDNDSKKNHNNNHNRNHNENGNYNEDIRLD